MDHPYSLRTLSFISALDRWGCIQYHSHPGQEQKKLSEGAVGLRFGDIYSHPGPVRWLGGYLPSSLMT